MHRPAVIAAKLIGFLVLFGGLGAATVTTGYLLAQSGDTSQAQFLIFFFFVLIVGLLVGMMAAAVAFAALGGPQLNSAVGLMREKPGQTFLSGVIVGLPAVVAFSVTGSLWLSVLLLLGLLPGLVTVGTWLGSLVLRNRRERGSVAHPYAEALIGSLLLWAAAVLTLGLGLLFVYVMSVWGTGALTYLIGRRLVLGPPAAPAAPGGPGVPLAT